MRRWPVGGVVALLASGAAGAQVAPFSEQLAAFSLRAHGELIPYRTFGLYLLPGEALEVLITQQGPRRSSTLTVDWPGMERVSAGLWRGRVPEKPGLYSARVAAAGDSIQLNVFVLVPASQVVNQSLRGYRIGSYPSTPFRGLSSYRPPRGYIEVTPANEHVAIGPHFTLGQFVCKQAGGYPKFVVMRERMILKLESLLALVNARGIAADTFFVMSGYRTPSYNAAIGNVGYSRHQYGDAADIFVDVNPRDGIMDDVNGDGRITVADAHFLYDLFDSFARRESADDAGFVGGMGSYGVTSNHGPFVHVDARGYRARWGR